MNRTLKATLAFGVIAFLISALPVQAYVLLSPRRSWQAGSVTVVVNSSGNSTIGGDGGVAAVAAAVKEWQGVVSSSTSSSQAVRGDGSPMISLHTNGNICTGNCLAATLTGYYHQSGGSYYINDADVYTNQRYNFTKAGDGCSGEFYIEGIMVHEVGHVIGIGHSDVVGSTMYPSVGYCDNGPATLHSDDTAAMKDLYPSGGGSEPPPPSSCTDADGDGHCSTFTGGDDCNDGDSKIHPGANDTKGKWGRDGVDNDCNGVIDG